MEGTLLGILNLQVWVREEIKVEPDKNKKQTDRRKTPIENKESYKLLKSYKALYEVGEEHHKDCHLVSLCDREDDIFELIYEHAKITNEYISNANKNCPK